jgi:non-canonical purine NTP pyrophosphatase (RdgB/HAM1 family)
MQVTFVTGNKNKLAEAEKILGIALDSFAVDLDEIQGLDPIKISEHKVMQAWDKLQKPLFVLDQSICIHCLNDFPGPLIKWFWEQVTLKKICDIANSFNDHVIRTETVITYFDGVEIKHFKGEISGTIPTEPRGEKGWGWDPIFIPEGQEKTYGEMDPKEILKFRSHKIALEKLRDFLNQVK